jgi:hypothetical protein
MVEDSLKEMNLTSQFSHFFVIESESERERARERETTAVTLSSQLNESLCPLWLAPEFRKQTDGN